MMTERQRKILEVVIKEYVKSSKPISSKFIAQKFKPELSSATIRNEMKELGKDGYLNQPHTAAGRIPTEKAYRLFIKSLEDKEIKVPVKISKKPFEDSFKDITQKLAEMSGTLAFSGIKELKSFYQTGFSNLFKEPEFEDRDYFSETAEMMEEFEKHFDDLFETISEHKTRVFIGKENPFGKTSKLTLIVSGCKIPEKKHGVIGLLGPMRMRYDYNISLINRLRQILENHD